MLLVKATKSFGTSRVDIEFVKVHEQARSQRQARFGTFTT